MYSYIYIFPAERTAYTGFPLTINAKEVKLNIEKLIQEIEQEDSLLDTKANINQEKTLMKLIKLRELLDEKVDTTNKGNKPIIKGSAAIQSLV
ncbi:hypothetical protein NIES4071_64020 [Calothrix sp. NIES-4071]|nr:hypothetical protein NIES4071_64020 [Calothrix sp. NIES-4071]BAZ60706.1 hypothetical protein NIES4105_63980 [Calothrix sp. NIES-4105]